MTVPDLPGCVADGETIDAAIAEAHDAFKAWAAAEAQDRHVANTQDLQRPVRPAHSLHQRLAIRAAAEGVSLK